MSLIGRQRELAALDGAWARAVAGSPQMAVVWGRRRVGKTFLLSEFTAGLPTVFFTATRNDTEAEQLRRLHEATERGLGDRAALTGGGFRDLEGALRFFFETARSTPMVLVIDEVPRLSAARADVGDVIAAAWDARPAECRLFLILCGSAVAAMRDLLGPDGGLYRRADPELRLDPLDPWEAAELLGTDDGEVITEAYAACGGYPLHLAAWDVGVSTRENLQRLAGSAGGLLVRDALDIMFEDLDFRSGYERVLATMRSGPMRRSRIAGRAQQRIDQTLAKLQRAGYVVAERSLGSPPTADPLYRLVDPYLRFWFAVLRDDAELIDGGQGRAVLDRVQPRWESHVQSTFEEIARSDAARRVATGELPSAIIGRWWRDEQAEVDVLGLDSTDRAILIGEAKWQSHPIDRGQLRRLREVGDLVPVADHALFCLWSRSGVDASIAGTPDLVHFSATTMFGGEAQKRPLDQNQ